MSEYKWYSYKDGDLCGCEACGADDVPLTEYTSGWPEKLQYICEICMNSFCLGSHSTNLSNSIAIWFNILRKDLKAFESIKEDGIVKERNEQ